jgi:hypothetical protein
VGKLGDELNRSERQLDSLDQNDAEKLLAAQERETARIERIILAFSTGEDMTGFASPEETEEIGAVLAEIAPILES